MVSTRYRVQPGGRVKVPGGDGDGDSRGGSNA
jgi:hypothetical protein